MDSEFVIAIVSAAIALAALVIAGITAVFARSQTRSAAASAEAAQVQARRAGEEVEIARRSAEAAREQVNAAHRQIELEEQARRDQAQPYVVADVVPSPGFGHLLQVVVTNHGPTVARDVRVTFDPALMSRWQGEAPEQFTALDGGISFLAPGRSLKWHLGISPEYFDADGSPEDCRVVIDCAGPFGDVPSLVYRLSLATMKGAEATAPGTLARVEKAVQDLTAAVKARR